MRQATVTAFAVVQLHAVCRQHVRIGGQLALLLPLMVLIIIFVIVPSCLHIAFLECFLFMHAVGDYTSDLIINFSAFSPFVPHGS
jgi:hypothetical protein